MKVVIANGYQEADYIISMFKETNNEIIVINQDDSTCRFLSESNAIPVFRGKPTKIANLKDADIENADLFIALSSSDIDNYEACMIAKRLFNVKRCIARVSNPKNVEVFKQLGIDSVVSSTYLLAEQIRSVSGLKDMINQMSLEDNKISILEIVMQKDTVLCGKSLMETNISHIASISCVYRDANVIIPNGQTVLMPGDKVLVVTTEENKQQIIDLFKRKK